LLARTTRIRSIGEKTFELQWLDQNDQTRSVTLWQNHYPESKQATHNSPYSPRTGEVAWETGAQAILRFLNSFPVYGLEARAVKSSAPLRPYSFAGLSDPFGSWVRQGRWEHVVGSFSLPNIFQNLVSMVSDFINPSESDSYDSAHKSGSRRNELLVLSIPNQLIDLNPNTSSELIAQLIEAHSKLDAHHPFESEIVYIRIEDITEFNLPSIKSLLNSKLGATLSLRLSENSLPEAIVVIIELVPNATQTKLDLNHLTKLIDHLEEWPKTLREHGILTPLRIALVSDDRTLPSNTLEQSLAFTEALRRVRGTTPQSAAEPRDRALGQIRLSELSSTVFEYFRKKLNQTPQLVDVWPLLSRNSRLQHLSELIETSVALRLSAAEIDEILIRAEHLLPRLEQRLDAYNGISSVFLEALKFAKRNSNNDSAILFAEAARILAASLGGFTEPRFEVEDLKRIEALGRKLNASSTTASPINFIGRERQIEAVKQNLLSAARGRFKDKATNVIVFFGESGTGKTELAEAIARETEAERRYIDLRNYDAMGENSLQKAAIALQASSRAQKILILDELDKSKSETVRNTLAATLGNRDGKDLEINLKGTTVIMILNIDVRNESYRQMLDAYKRNEPVKPYFVEVIRNALLYGDDSNDTQLEFRDADSFVKRFVNDAIFMPPISADIGQQEQLIDAKVRAYEREKGVRIVVPNKTLQFLIARAVENSDGNFRSVERAIPSFFRAAEAEYVIRNPNDEALTASKYYQLKPVESREGDSHLTLELAPLRLDDRIGVVTMLRDQQHRFYDRLIRHFREKEELFRTAKNQTPVKAQSDVLNDIANTYAGVQSELKALRSQVERTLIARPTPAISEFQAGEGNILFGSYFKLFPAALGLFDGDELQATELVGHEIDKGIITLSKLIATPDIAHAGTRAWYDTYLEKSGIDRNAPLPIRVSRVYIRKLGEVFAHDSWYLIDRMVDEGKKYSEEIRKRADQSNTRIELPAALAQCNELIKTRQSIAAAIEAQISKLPKGKSQ